MKRSTSKDTLRISCGMANDFKSKTVRLGDLVEKVTPNARLRVRVSLESGTMGAPYAVVEIEEA